MPKRISADWIRLKQSLKALALVPAALAIVVIPLVLYLRFSHPSLEPYEHLRLPARDSAAPGPGRLTVTFVGVTTLLFSDGDTAIMTDGFFSRPGVLRLLKTLRPNSRMIDRALRRLSLLPRNRPALMAVIPLHSHYDHVLDAPMVAKRTGARLAGSPSTFNVAMAHGLAAGNIDLVRYGDSREYGSFKVTFIPSAHGPDDLFPGFILSPFDTAADVRDYRTGDIFALLVEHDSTSILVLGSAGFVPDALARIHADVVYLPIGRLGGQDAIYRAAYWKEVVQATRARRIVLTHWDDFFRPLRDRLPPMPTLLQDFGETMDELCRWASRDTIDLRLAREWAPADPLAGLPPTKQQMRVGACPRGPA